MIEVYRAFALSGWLDVVLRLSLAAGGVLVAVLLADLALSRRVSARWRAALYLAVFVRLALPASWTSPIGVVVREVRAPAVTTTVAGVARVPTAAAPLPPASAAPMPWPLVVTPGVALALVVALVLARAAAARVVRGSRPPSARLRALAGPVAVVEHDRRGPAVYGLLRPVVVLPSALVEKLDDDALAAVIRHEAAHVARRDPWRLTLLQIATFLAWPVAPAWIAAWRVRGLMEQACDEAALAGGGAAQRRSYGEALLAVAEWQPRHVRFALGLLPFGGGLASRLRALRFTRRWPAVAQLATIAALAGASVLASGQRVVASAPAGGEVAVRIETRTGLTRLPVPEATALASVGPEGEEWLVLKGAADALQVGPARSTTVASGREGEPSLMAVPGPSGSRGAVRWTPRPGPDGPSLELGWESRDGDATVLEGGMTVTSSRGDGGKAIIDVPVRLAPGEQAALAVHEPDGSWTLVGFAPLRDVATPEARMEVVLRQRCPGEVSVRREGDVVRGNATCAGPEDARAIADGLVAEGLEVGEIAMVPRDGGVLMLFVVSVDDREPVRLARRLLDESGAGTVRMDADGRLEIEGQCASPVDLAKILRSFEDSPRFRDVALERQATEPATGGTTFAFSATWRPGEDGELESLVYPEFRGGASHALAFLTPHLSPRGDVQVDHRTGAVVVRDTPERLGEIAKLVEAATPQRVMVTCTTAVVKTSELGQLGLRQTGVTGLALPAERESPFLFDFRLLTLEERKLARIVSRPAVLIDVGVDGRISAEGVGTFDVRVRPAGESLAIDVTIDMPRLFQHGKVEGSGPLGAWALVAPARTAGETVVVLVQSALEQPAETAKPAASSAEQRELLGTAR